MKVSFSPVNTLYQKQSFGAVSKEYEKAALKSKQDKITTAKTKKVISECTTLAIGTAILYFAMKYNLKMNGIKSAARKANQAAQIPRPEIALSPADIASQIMR